MSRIASWITSRIDARAVTLIIIGSVLINYCLVLFLNYERQVCDTTRRHATHGGRFLKI